MRKFLCFLLCCLAVFSALCPLPSGKAFAAEDLELNIMNWEEYIDEGDDETPSVIDSFIEYYKDKYGKTVTVNYSTQGTNENMYTELNVNKNHYDLVCPSEYMIQKMIKEDMLEPINRTSLNVDVYDSGVSPYIANLFKQITIDGKSLYDYACCYMWGTMGYVYNPLFVDQSDVEHWSAVWNEKYDNKCTIKDSVRDSYVLALGYSYSKQLLELADQWKKGEITAEEYNLQITEIFNKTDYQSLSLALDCLKVLNDSLYGYEVDSGKKDMAAGKIWINFAWSGDAVYALDYAEDPDMVGQSTAELYYTVPLEGSNIFFDGWVMPKGANVELAQEFINFIQRPDIALRNMWYIGYTTSIATEEIFDYLVDEEEGYGYREEDVTLIDGAYFVGEGEDLTEVFPVDLTYLFAREAGDSYVVYTDTLGRQFSAQYPDFDTVNRCTVMRHLSDSELTELNNIWADSKEGTSGTKGLYIAIAIAFGLIVFAAAAIWVDKTGILNRHGKKGYTVVKKEDIY
ncbi:MAG: extracellular solute-binding protein [Clostridia bacterium]|nr:extracellular solute-binding protein [Clostridia bacterium]